MNDEPIIFQHYQVLRREDGSLWELGRGAMGVTYKAFDTNLRCDVALKVVSAQHLHSEVARQRFIREARAAAQLRHRNIATVYHLGVDPQTFFYSMEFVAGETLDCLVERVGPLSPETVLGIGLQTARALAAASRQGLIHRDIKPANLMVLHEDEDGEDRLHVKVIDFGLARSFTANDTSVQLTVSGFVGTPQYASPEQLEEEDLDVRSDIYSLGVTMWFLLTGKPPFMGKLASVISQHLGSEPPWWQLAGCPEPVRALLKRMLSKDPAHRHQSALELRREIESCLRLTAREIGLPTPERVFETDHVQPKTETASNTAGDESTRPPTDPADPAVGDVLGGRFELLRLAGEGGAARIFRAQDLQGESRIVAAKVYHRQWFAGEDDYTRLAAEAEKVRAAPNAGLLEVVTVGRWQDCVCVLTEWAGATTLVDVLRQRGVLAGVEALALLRQAADAADHAATHGLSFLGFEPRDILLVPPGGPPVETGIVPRAALADGPLLGRLKFDALAGAHSTGDLATWAGGVTMTALPPPRVFRASGKADDSTAAGDPGYPNALACLFYELVNGTAPSAVYAVVPRLREGTNTILRAALTTGGSFANGLDFFETLARAEGFVPSDFDRPQSLPVPVKASPEPAKVPSPPAAFPLPVPPVILPPVFALGGPLLPAAIPGRSVDSTTWRQSRYLGISLSGATLIVLGMLAVIYFQQHPAGKPPAAAPAVRSAAKVNLFPTTQAAASVLPAAVVASPPPPPDLKPILKAEPPSFLWSGSGVALETPAADANFWAAPASRLFMPQQPPPGLDRSPISALTVAAAAPLQLAAPAAEIDQDDDADDNDPDASTKKGGSDRSRSRSHGSRRKTPAPRPNIFQRIFGIKPKHR